MEHISIIPPFRLRQVHVTLESDQGQITGIPDQRPQEPGKHRNQSLLVKLDFSLFFHSLVVYGLVDPQSSCAISGLSE